MNLTPQQEAFAQAVASGLSQSDAYRKAYTVKPSTKATSVNVNACKLMADANISQRVAELRAPIAEQAQITLASHLERLEHLSKKAEEDGQFSAAISAEVARGKAAGVHVEKSELAHTGSVGFLLEVIGVEPAKG